LLSVLTRMLFALLFVGGAGTGIGVGPIGSEPQLSEEVEDEREREREREAEREGVPARMRQPQWQRPAGAKSRKQSRVLQEITSADPTSRRRGWRPRWQLPRRVPPSDDDGPTASS
jgi:hypothetical protein